MQKGALSAPALPFGLRWALVAALAVLSPLAQANSADSRKSESMPQDRIAVVGHIALPEGRIIGLVPTRHFSSDYLYAEYAPGGKVVLIDITKPAQPSVVTDFAYPAAGSANNIIAASGTAAVTVDARPSALPAGPPQSVRILSFADTQHPKVVREFSGVTAVGRDDSRGLIFLADATDLWILQESPAEDPAVEAAYAHEVLYNH